MLESLFLLFRFLEQPLGLIQLGLVHGLDVVRLDAPFRLELVQFVAQFPVLRFEEADFLDVAREALVQILDREKVKRSYVAENKGHAGPRDNFSVCESRDPVHDRLIF